MGQLTLIRHGQARAFEQDSDRLSELGELQARKLGEYWLRQTINFDEVYCGTLVRQCQTAEIVRECFAAAGHAWPEMQNTAALNEYDATGLWQRLAPALAESDAEFRSLHADFQQHHNTPERNRYFQRMFEALTTRWLRGEVATEGVESWLAFRERVRSALKQIIAREGSGRHVAIFTSGGVIGLTMQTVLQAPEDQALQINWRIRNCSLTEFTFNRERLSLDSFNALPHLDDPAWRTYR